MSQAIYSKPKTSTDHYNDLITSGDRNEIVKTKLKNNPLFSKDYKEY